MHISDRLTGAMNKLFILSVSLVLFSLQFEISRGCVVVSCIISVSPRYFVEMSSQIAYEV